MLLRLRRTAPYWLPIGGLLVGALVGYRVGTGKFPSGIPTPSLLTSEVFWATIIGALVGGIFTLLGGRYGSLLLVNGEQQRQRNELVGAIQVTRSEIARNIASITDQIDKDLGALNIQLFDSSYRSLEPALAAGLPMPLFGWIGIVNNQLVRVQSIIDRARLNPEGGMSNNEIMDIRDLRERLVRLNRLLLRYLRETLKVNVPDVPVETTTTPQNIENRLEQTLFGNVRTPHKV